MANCSEIYIRSSDPERFLSQMDQFNEVSGTEDMTVRIDVRKTHLGVVQEVANIFAPA
jgi:hypothetical protein